MGEGLRAASRLRPRPSIVVVLTDGMTEWPADPPKGIQVVIGLLSTERTGSHRPWATPAWARVVPIDAAA
ncbi:MAG: DUF2201 family putative metallopeptidase, partial [Acidimicrobiales bacterium]